MKRWRSAADSVLDWLSRRGIAAVHGAADAAALDDYRYEIKFGLAPTALPELHAWVRSHRAGFRSAHPDRQVNSLYFDSAEWQALGDNLAGVPDRAKFRARWYGADLSCIDGRLELKCKRNQLGRKLTHPLDPPLHLDDRPWHAIVHDLRQRDLGVFSRAIDSAPCPTLLVTYRRTYLVSADGAVRLTVDTDLTTFDQSREGMPNLTRKNIAPAPSVVEIKGASAMGETVAEIAREVPLRRVAYSKYCAGVLGGLGPV